MNIHLCTGYGCFLPYNGRAVSLPQRPYAHKLKLSGFFRKSLPTSGPSIYFYIQHSPKQQRRRRQWHPHSSTLAWKIPWLEEPGRLQSMGQLRAGHDSVTSLSLFTFVHGEGNGNLGRKWQPTPVFLPGEFQGRGSLVGCHLWGRTESDTTEATQQQQQQQSSSMPQSLAFL